jgi:hypothetical protein
MTLPLTARFFALVTACSAVTVFADGAAVKKGMQCMNIKPASVELGYLKSYKVAEGMSVKEMDGFLDRKTGKLEGCILPNLEPDQCAVFIYTKPKGLDLTNSNDWELQCVLADAPEKGMLNQDYRPPGMQVVKEKDMLIKCGHDQGKLECLDGSHSMRGGEFRKRLDAKNQEMLSVCGYRAQSSDPKEYQGVNVVCQYYNKPQKKVLFGFEYNRAAPK